VKGMTRIVRIEWAQLVGQRPRVAGCNARLGEHGQRVSVPLARVTTDEGVSGFGWSPIAYDRAAGLIGCSLDEMFDPQGGVRERFRALDHPLWDLAGQLAGKPVYALLGGQASEGGGYRVPCYDTSLYMDDLHLEDDGAAAACIVSEAQEGMARGHRSFKIKVGRGAMHMPLEAGTRRDICVIRAVREAVGAGARIMLDANNGYNLNLTKHVLAETADARVYWIEEPFHEDGRLYADLKGWLAVRGLEVLIADGEGDASPHLLEWARDGLIDVVQYDIRSPGFSRWLELGPQLDGWGVRSAPHHYGGMYGNYSACHVAARIRGFEFVEWDEAAVPGLDPSAYRISEGYVHVPNLPGFGLRLDDKVYARAVEENGYTTSDERSIPPRR
jgi:L-rhamnonate dehydratase